MSASMFIAIFAAATVAAYVCRFERLTWVQHPFLTAAHWAGAVLAMWALTSGAAGHAAAREWVLLGGSVAMLALLYRRVPEAEAPAVSAAPAPVQKEALRHVSGGAAAPSRTDQRP